MKKFHETEKEKKSESVRASGFRPLCYQGTQNPK